MGDIKYHFGEPFYSGYKAKCGRTRTRLKIKDRAKWDTMTDDERCSDCIASVKRDGAPRPDRICAIPRGDFGSAAASKTGPPRSC